MKLIIKTVLILLYIPSSIANFILNTIYEQPMFFGAQVVIINGKSYPHNTIERISIGSENGVLFIKLVPKKMQKSESHDYAEGQTSKSLPKPNTSISNPNDKDSYVLDYNNFGDFIYKSSEEKTETVAESSLEPKKHDWLNGGPVVLSFGQNNPKEKNRQIPNVKASLPIAINPRYKIDTLRIVKEFINKDLMKSNFSKLKCYCQFNDILLGVEEGDFLLSARGIFKDYHHLFSFSDIKLADVATPLTVMDPRNEGTILFKIENKDLCGIAKLHIIRKSKKPKEKLNMRKLRLYK
jgi:hypothetical protein